MQQNSTFNFFRHNKKSRRRKKKKFSRNTNTIYSITPPPFATTTTTTATTIVMPTTTTANKNDRRLREFLLWCEQKGCELSKVHIKSIDSYKVETPKGHALDYDEETGGEKEFDRRVYCRTADDDDDNNNNNNNNNNNSNNTNTNVDAPTKTTMIKKGEPDFVRPFCVFCVGTQGLRVGTGGDSLPPFEQATSSERLAAELLRQRDLKEKSEFYPYINALPKVIDSPTCKGRGRRRRSRRCNSRTPSGRVRRRWRGIR